MALKNVSHPCEVLCSLIESSKYDFQELSVLFDMDVEQVIDLLSCRLDIDETIAAKIGIGLETGPDMWLKMQRLYNDSSNNQ